MKRTLFSILLTMGFTALAFSQPFIDVTSSAGLDLKNIQVLTVFDYNNDDFQDLIISYYEGTNLVYTLMQNNGDKTFTDVGVSVGLPLFSPLVFDYDNDGYPDIVVIDDLDLRIYRNVLGEFQEVTTDLGITNPLFESGETNGGYNNTFQAHDYDFDGDLDIVYIRTDAEDVSISALVNNYQEDAFYEKDKILPGLPGPISFVLFDMDHDFDLDVVGLYGTSSWSPGTMYLWENDNGSYTDVTAGSGLVSCYPRTMLAVDFNNDGHLDVVKGGADGGGGNDYRIFLNDGTGKFTDASSSYVIRTGSHYYTNPNFVDFDNDFDKDIHWENMRSLTDGRLRLFQDDGNLVFTEVSDVYGIHLGSTIGGVPIRGFTPSVFFDYDNDGDLDVFIGDYKYYDPFDGVGYFMENTMGGNYLKVKANGCSTNREGKAVKISATIGAETQVNYNSIGVNTFGVNRSNIFHFGTGDQTIIDELRVLWQNGTETVLTDVEANQYMEVNEEEQCPGWYGCTVFDTITTMVYDTTMVFDTTFVTIRDTLTTEVFDTTYITETEYVSVTDTLIIDALLTGIDPPGNLNTLKVYPNPAKDHIFINTGDFTRMNGYQLKIINQLGSVVFETNIEEPLYEVNLSTWMGMGLYYVQVIDPAGSIIDIRKIVLQ